MKPSEIKRGHFYRFRGGLTVCLVLHTWPNSSEGNDKPPECEIVPLQHGHIASNYTRVMAIAEFAHDSSEEVRPQWVDLVVGGPELRFDKERPERVRGQCQVRQYHMFPSAAPTAVCDDCGITVGEAVRQQQERLAAEEHAKGEQLHAEAMAKQEPAPELPEVSAADAFLASLTGTVEP